jgi:hypothetical protein
MKVLIIATNLLTKAQGPPIIRPMFMTAAFITILRDLLPISLFWWAGLPA